MTAREPEHETERARLRHQRGLFDGVARLYEATRPGYPAELVAPDLAGVTDA